MKTNEILSEAILQWRTAAQEYRESKNRLEVPDPLASANRLEHLADQAEHILMDRIRSGIMDKSVLVPVATLPRGHPSYEVDAPSPVQRRGRKPRPVSQ